MDECHNSVMTMSIPLPTSLNGGTSGAALLCPTSSQTHQPLGAGHPPLWGIRPVTRVTDPHTPAIAAFMCQEGI